MKRQVLEIDKMQHLKELGVATSNASFIGVIMVVDLM